MRLMKLRTIQKEKIDRSRAWFWIEIAAGRFPKPVVDDLWSEEAVDAAVAAYTDRMSAKGSRSANVRAARQQQRPL